MDKLRLELRAMDMIQPELRDLKDTMDHLSMLPEDFEGKVKVTLFMVSIIEITSLNLTKGSFKNVV